MDARLRGHDVGGYQVSGWSEQKRLSPYKAKHHPREKKTCLPLPIAPIPVRKSLDLLVHSIHLR